MAKKIFIAGSGQHHGKSTVCLGVFHSLKKKFNRVAYIKPVGQQCEPYHKIMMDKDAAVMADTYGLHDSLPFLSPVQARGKFSRNYLDGEISLDLLKSKLSSAYKEVASNADAVVIEGTGHTGVGTVFGLNNAEVAGMLKAGVVLIIPGGIGNAIDLLAVNLELYNSKNVPVKGVILNKVIPEKMDQVKKYVGPYLKKNGMELLGLIPYNAILANPTLKAIASYFAVPLEGDPGIERIVDHFELGSASTRIILTQLRPKTLIISPASRDDTIMTCAISYQFRKKRKSHVRGLILCGENEPRSDTMDVVRESGIPYMNVPMHSSEVFLKMDKFTSKIGVGDKAKIEQAQKMVYENINMAGLIDIMT